MNGTTETTKDPRESAPLEDMTKAQLLAFADEVGIDLTGVKRTKAEVLRAIIAAPRPAGGAATNEATGETTPAGEPLPEVPAWAQGRLTEVLADAGVPPTVHRVDVLDESIAVAYRDEHGTLVGRHVPVDAETRDEIVEQLLDTKEA